MVARGRRDPVEPFRPREVADSGRREVKTHALRRYRPTPGALGQSPGINAYTARAYALEQRSGAAVITSKECLEQSLDCAHQARGESATKKQRDALYAMSRTWDTLARQAARLEELQVKEQA
jgi:hypothetical protein